MDPSQAISELGVVCGMTLPMLALPTVFLSAMSLVLVPRLARSTALNRPQAVRDTVSKALSAVSVLALPAMGMMAVLGEELGVLLFRQEAVGEYLLPLAAATALSCYQAILGASLNGVGRQGTVAWISLVCDGVQLAFTACLVGVPSVGMGGFVAGMLVSTALGLVLCAWRLRAFTGLSFHLFHWVTAPGLAALLSALVTNLLFQVLRDSGVPVLGVSPVPWPSAWSSISPPSAPRGCPCGGCSGWSKGNAAHTGGVFPLLQDFPVPISFRLQKWGSAPVIAPPL